MSARNRLGAALIFFGALVASQAQSHFADEGLFADESWRTKDGREVNDLMSLSWQCRYNKDWPGAIAALTKVIELSPGYPDAYGNRGEVRLETHDYAGAEKDYTQAIRLRPGRTKLYTDRGYARSNLGKHWAASADFRMALVLDPKNEYAQVELAIKYVDLRQYRTALREIDLLLAQRPNDVRLRSARALARCGLEDYYGAIGDCDAVLSQDPKVAAAFQYRGLAKYLLGQRRAALQDYDQFVALSGRSDFSLLVRGIVLEMTGDLPAALADFDAAVATTGNKESALLVHRAIVRQRLGQPADDLLARAVATWTEAEAVSLGQYLLGQISEEQLLRAATRANPESNPDYVCLACYFSGMTNLLQGKKERGVELLQQCAFTHRDSYEYWLALAELARLRNPILEEIKPTPV